MAVAIILAAGEGHRLGAGAPKAFLSVGGPTMLELSMRTAAACPRVEGLLVTTPAGMTEAVEQVAGVEVPVAAVEGGASRQESVQIALEALRDADGVPPTEVVIHDAARPFASAQLFTLALAALAVADGAIPVLPVTDTVKRVRDDLVAGTEARQELFLAQTPQAFRYEALVAAHRTVTEQGLEITDDAQALEVAGLKVAVVPGEPDNLKITTPVDLARAEAIVATGGALR